MKTVGIIAITVFVCFVFVGAGLLIARNTNDVLKGDLDAAKASYTSAYAKYEEALSESVRAHVRASEMERIQKARDSYR